MDSLSKTIKHEIDNGTNTIPIVKKCAYGTYFLVNNIITGIKFEGTLAYECLIDKVELWKKFPEADIGNEWYFIKEIQRCTRREVDALLHDFSRILKSNRTDDMSFLITLQNACTNIINSQK